MIRNEASGVQIADLIEERAAVAPRAVAGPKLDSEAQQQWLDFVERFVAQMRFDDPGQPSPRHGGTNWMRVPLPGPAALTLWRSKPQGVVGAFASFKGSDALDLYQMLLADREVIDHEFIDNDLLPPLWKQEAGEASVALEWPSPWPWSDKEEERQMDLMGRAANQLVNSLRPRILMRAS